MFVTSEATRTWVFEKSSGTTLLVQSSSHPVDLPSTGSWPLFRLTEDSVKRSDGRIVEIADSAKSVLESMLCVCDFQRPADLMDLHGILKSLGCAIIMAASNDDVEGVVQILRGDLQRILQDNSITLATLSDTSSTKKFKLVIQEDGRLTSFPILLASTARIPLSLCQAPKPCHVVDLFTVFRCRDHSIESLLVDSKDSILICDIQGSADIGSVYRLAKETKAAAIIISEQAASKGDFHDVPTFAMVGYSLGLIKKKECTATISASSGQESPPSAPVPTSPLQQTAALNVGSDKGEPGALGVGFQDFDASIPDALVPADPLLNHVGSDKVEPGALAVVFENVGVSVPNRKF
jgi:hypothetical protein